MNCRYRLVRRRMLITQWCRCLWRAEMDNELEQVFVDVGSLPTMVTPVCDP